MLATKKPERLNSPMLAFSTSWNMHRHTDGERMVEEILSLGVDTIELGHGLKISQIDGILKSAQRGDIRVCSLHNFCPHPLEVSGDSPDCFVFTSKNAAERRRAVRLTKATIELASQFQAGLVVMHGGRIRTQRHYQKALELLEEKKFLTKEYGDFKVEAVRAREEAAPPVLARLSECLREVLPLAEEHNVVLGMENRERYEDVPSERELPGLLAGIGNPCLGYWHDFGHARIKENLAFLDHAAYFEQMLPHLVGCHVHDVRWPNQDHQPPFSGEIDWSSLVPKIPSHVPMIFEMSPHLTVEEVRHGLRLWKERFPE